MEIHAGLLKRDVSDRGNFQVVETPGSFRRLYFKLFCNAAFQLTGLPEHPEESAKKDVSRKMFVDIFWKMFYNKSREQPIERLALYKMITNDRRVLNQGGHLCFLRLLP